MQAADFLSTLGFDRISGVGLAVVAVLVLLSVWSFSIAVERALTLWRARRQSIAFARALESRPECGQDDWLRGAVTTAGEYTQSHLARVVVAGLVAYQQKSARGTLPPEAVIEAAGRAVERSSLVTLTRLRRGLGTLATIATIAPFVGLFGTVVGIMHCFRDIAAHGPGGFATVSQGIAEALVTTALGILVAIPAAWMFNAFTERIERLRVEMESSSAELLEFFLELSAPDPA